MGQNVRVKNGRREGFSLVLALALMGMIVLVVLTVAAFLNLESRLASAALSQARARLNASAAARLAIAQLQQLAGHDQRVTARADLLDPAATGGERNTYLKLAMLNEQRRWWTGVWCTGGADSSKLRDWNPAAPDSRLFAGWLVSPQGSDQVLSLRLDRAVTSLQSNAVVRQVEVPTTGLRGRIALLGGDSLPADTTLVGGRVESDVSTFPDSGGGYAWWTADEGIKARANLSDPLAAKSGPPRIETQGVNDWWRGFAGVACGRVGVELAGTTSGDTASLPLRPSAFLPGYQASREAALSVTTPWTGNPVLTVGTREDLQSWAAGRAELDAATKAASVAGIARGWHDLTTCSRGVLSNPLDGGLRVDLSMAFELPFATVGTTKGWVDLPWFHQSQDSNSVDLAAATGVSPATDPQSEEWNATTYKLGYVYEIVIPSDERAGRGQSPYVLRGPTWDLLRNHYRLYKREREAASITGVGTAFAASADAWLARGSEPYTFAQGSGTQYATAPKAPGAPTTSAGVFGAKSNPSALQPVAAAAAANYRHQSTFTLADGAVASRPWETRARLAPHVVRVGMVHSLIYCTNTLAIGLDPFMVVHNPYNVPVEFVGIGLNWAQFNNTTYSICRSDTGLRVAYCTLGQDQAQRSFTFRMFNTPTPGKWRQAPQANIRMLPGETQIITPNLAGDRWQVPRDTSNTNVCMGAFVYDLQGNFRINGYRVDPATDTPTATMLSQVASTVIDGLVAPPAGAAYASEPLYVKMQVSDAAQYNTFQTYLFRPSRYASTLNLNQSGDPGYRTWLGSSLNPYADCADEHLLQQVAFRARPSNLAEPGTGVLQSPPYNRYPFNDATARIPGKNFFAITDLRLRSAKETNGFPMPLQALNPRAVVADPRNLDNGGDTSPAWTIQIRAVSGDPSINEFQMWPGATVGLGRNLVAWGNAFEPATATTPVVLFQVPTRPLLSLAQLAHADIGLVDTDAGYAIGNSNASPWIDTLDKLVSWPTSPANALERVDIAYAANLGLWDRCFFSGFNAGTAKAPSTGTNPASGKTYDGSSQPYANVSAAVDALFLGAQDVLANRRMTWGRFPRATATAGDTALKAAFVDPTQTAKQILHEGTFNVNSTSVAAWKAQLASGFQALANGNAKTPDYPFSRQAPPTGESVESGNANRWSAYRSLAESDGTLTKLAEAIVAEVRARGPFMSLSDFVNRRLATDATGRKGALQAAIDAVASPAINTAVNTTALGATASPRILQPAAISPTTQAADIPVALGRPDQLLQSDILAALGPGLAARSDTFVIRAYGEDGTGQGGRAWCEVTVQRLPEWVVPTNQELNTPNAGYRTGAAATRGATVDTLQRNAGLGAVNRQLGRRFAIVSFRWIPAPTP